MLKGSRNKGRVKVSELDKQASRDSRDLAEMEKVKEH